MLLHKVRTSGHIIFSCDPFSLIYNGKIEEFKCVCMQVKTLLGLPRCVMAYPLVLLWNPSLNFQKEL
jgi:hypothetical protein